MLLSLLLLKKIASLFLFLLIGFALVRLKMIDPHQTGCIAVFVAYVLNPAVVISSLQREYSPSLVKGLAFNCAVGVVVILVFVLLAKLLNRPLKLKNVEQASLAYPSTASLVVPLTASVLGEEYSIYVLGMFMMQQFFIWSHMQKLLSPGSRFSIKKFLLNPNILALIVGLALFFLNLPLPSVLQDTVDILTTMLGPMSMFIAGLLIGGMELKKVLTNMRVWLTAFGRLILFPLVVLALIKISHVSTLIEDGDTLLLIVLLGASGPPTSIIASLAQLNGEDAPHASAINALSSMFCVLTMPFIIYLYQLWP